MYSHIYKSIGTIFRSIGIGALGKINLSKIEANYVNLTILSYSDLENKYKIEVKPLLHSYGIFNKDGSLIGQGDQFRIIYNDKMPETRQRFTIAHELGHYFLGHTDDSKVNEDEANIFARNLLCNPFVTDIIVKNSISGNEAIRRVALFFDVSSEMAAYRINALKDDIREISKFYSLNKTERECAIGFVVIDSKRHNKSFVNFLNYDHGNRNSDLVKTETLVGSLKLTKI